jgi:hypothetical protein
MALIRPGLIPSAADLSDEGKYVFDIVKYLPRISARSRGFGSPGQVSGEPPAAPAGWVKREHNLLPGHVVCSSLAAMLYDLPSVGWAHPDLGDERQCEPADWWSWSEARSWAVPV